MKRAATFLELLAVLVAAVLIFTTTVLIVFAVLL